MGIPFELLNFLNRSKVSAISMLSFCVGDPDTVIDGSFLLDLESVLLGDFLGVDRR